MPFAKVYPMYVSKAERKGRKKEEVDQIICWLTGYDQEGLESQIERQSDFETFFADCFGIERQTAYAGRYPGDWENPHCPFSMN